MTSFATEGRALIKKCLSNNCAVSTSAPSVSDLTNDGTEIGSKAGGESVLMALHPLTARISSMPADIYTNTDNATAVRVDSAHSTASSTSWPSWRKRNGESGDGVPDPADLWATILVAVTYRSVTEEIVEALMHEIFPDMDVKSFLVRRGDPAQRFTDAENDIIRAKMRSLLDPDYEELWKLK